MAITHPFKHLVALLSASPGLKVPKSSPGLKVPKFSSSIAALALILLFFPFQPTSGLKCFECGAYIPPDEFGSPVKLLPCPESRNLSIVNDVKECKKGQIYCLKYISQGIQVRKCAESCVDHHNPYTDRTISCCDDDACNATARILASLPFVSLGVFWFLLVK